MNHWINALKNMLTGWNEWKASLKYYEHLRWRCTENTKGNGNVLKCAKNICSECKVIYLCQMEKQIFYSNKILRFLARIEKLMLVLFKNDEHRKVSFLHGTVNNSARRGADE